MTHRVKYGPPWTPEAVANEAKRYKTRTEFQKKAYGAYEAALRRYGNLDEVCSHMVSGRSLNRHWTQRKIIEIANSCRTYSEFRQKHPKAYKAVIRYRWQSLIDNLPRTQTPMGWWTLERVADEAIKYNTRTAFMKGSGGAYHAAHKNGWLDAVCAHMEQKQKPMRYWSRARVIAEAKRYSCRSDFQKSSGSAYSAAAKNGYLDEACAHMVKKGSQYERAIYAFEFEDHSVYVGLTFDYDIRYREHLTQNKHVGQKLKRVPAKYKRFNKWLPLAEVGEEEARVIEAYRQRGWKIINRAKPGGVGSKPRKWGFEEIKTLASTYETVSEFREENPSAYAVACRKGWWDKLSQNMSRSIEHGKWTPETLTAEAKKYITRIEFIKKNPGAYTAARKKGILDQVCAHMERLVKPGGYWTKPRVLKEAKRYKTLASFHKHSGGTYNKARKEGWLKEACAHMKQQRKPNGYWTITRVKQEAKKYNTRGEFMKKAVSAYNRAHKNGWLDEVCSHMQKKMKRS